MGCASWASAPRAFCAVRFGGAYRDLVAETNSRQLVTKRTHILLGLGVVSVIIFEPELSLCRTAAPAGAGHTCDRPFR